VAASDEGAAADPTVTSNAKDEGAAAAIPAAAPEATPDGS
jgi:hypothetical protein